MNNEVSVQLDYNDPEGWRALVPIPFWTTKTVPFWKRFNEDNWRPQCISHCSEVFKTRIEYDRHYMIYIQKLPSNFEDNWQQYFGGSHAI